MAGIAIPLITAAVGALSPAIPGIIQMMEDLIGHSSQSGGEKKGPAKMQGGVNIGMTLLQALANAGAIPSAPVVDPATPAAVAGAFQQAFDAMKKQGLLGPPATTDTAAAPTVPANGWTLPCVLQGSITFGVAKP